MVGTARRAKLESELEVGGLATAMLLIAVDDARWMLANTMFHCVSLKDRAWVYKANVFGADPLPVIFDVIAAPLLNGIRNAESDTCVRGSSDSGGLNSDNDVYVGEDDFVVAERSRSIIDPSLVLNLVTRKAALK